MSAVTYSDERFRFGTPLEFTKELSAQSIISALEKLQAMGQDERLILSNRVYVTIQDNPATRRILKMAKRKAKRRRWRDS